MGVHENKGPLKRNPEGRIPYNMEPNKVPLISETPIRPL